MQCKGFNNCLKNKPTSERKESNNNSQKDWWDYYKIQPENIRLIKTVAEMSENPQMVTLIMEMGRKRNSISNKPILVKASIYKDRFKNQETLR